MPATLQPIASQDRCVITDALEILCSFGLRFTRYLLFEAVNGNYVRATKNSNKWYFSKKSIDAFSEKYLDAHGVIALYKKRGCGKISKRRALQVMTNDLKNFTIKITNRYFIERQSVSNYLDKK